MLVKLVAAMALTALLTACAVPKSAMEVRAVQKHSASVCSPLSVEEAVKRIADGWKRCLLDAEPGEIGIVVNGQATLVPLVKRNPFVVNVETNGDVQTVSLEQPADGSMLMIADVRKTESCAALVELRGWNMIWNFSAAGADIFLRKADAVCPR